MIHINNKDISGVYNELKEIIAVYSGLILVWLKYSPSNPDEPVDPVNPIDPDNPIEGVLSCYSNGYWIDEYPWVDDLSWTN